MIGTRQTGSPWTAPMIMHMMLISTDVWPAPRNTNRCCLSHRLGVWRNRIFFRLRCTDIIPRRDTSWKADGSHSYGYNATPSWSDSGVSRIAQGNIYYGGKASNYGVSREWLLMSVSSKVLRPVPPQLQQLHERFFDVSSRQRHSGPHQLTATNRTKYAFWPDVKAPAR